MTWAHVAGHEPLDVDSAPEYLLAEGLISRRSIVHGNLEVTTRSRRNRNLTVRRDDGPGYLVKQPDDAEADTPASLADEVAFYTFCAEDEAARPVRSLLPRVSHIDPRRPLLALELLDRTQPLWEHVGSFAPHRFPAGIMRRLGSALSAVHVALASPGLAGHSGLSWLRRRTPWILQAHRPSPALLSTISGANYEILRILQEQPYLSRQLDSLRQRWEPLCVVHGDVKSDNVLIAADDDSPPGVYLVDWELVHLGDPAWDVAGALQECVIFWITSMSPAPTIEEMTATAACPLPLVQEGARSLLEGYFDTPELPDGIAAAVQERATSFSAARLIQSAYEGAQAADDLPSSSVLLLQVAANILSDPRGAADELYGLAEMATG